MLHVRIKEDGHHEPDDLAGREMLPCRFIGYLREATDQILENISHLIVAHGFRRKINIARKFLHDQKQEVRLVQTVNLGVDVKGLQYGAGIFRKALDIVDQIVPNQSGIAGQRLKGEFADIVKLMLADGGQKGSLVLVPYPLVLCHDRIMRIFQDAVQAAEYGKGQYNIAVFALLVVAPQKIGDFPYKVGRLRIHLCQFPSAVSLYLSNIYHNIF